MRDGERGTERSQRDCGRGRPPKEPETLQEALGGGVAEGEAKKKKKNTKNKTKRSGAEIQRLQRPGERTTQYGAGSQNSQDVAWMGALSR